MNKFIGCTLASAAILALAGGAASAQTPQRGGTLVFGTIGPPPTLDCIGFGLPTAMPALAPGYSTLLRFSGDSYPNVEGDLASSWTVSDDRLTYIFKLTPDVHFHDGSVLTSADVKASYDRMRNPPAKVVSLYQSLFSAISSIDTPDPLTVVFHLSKPNPIMLVGFGLPYGCIFSAKKLAEDPNYPAQSIMGTGPFKMGKFISGESIAFTRFENYFHKGMPYLDGLEIHFISGASTVTSLQGGQIDAVFNSVSPAAVATLKSTLGDKMNYTYVDQSGIAMLELNTLKAPFDDQRVRQAFQYGIDRPHVEEILRKASTQKGYGVVFGANVALDFKDDELGVLPGYGPDIAANRAKAKALLAESGAKDLHFSILGRNSGEVYPAIAITMIDQYRQIGVQIDQRLIDSASYAAALVGHNFDIAITSYVTTSSDPSEVLAKYLPDSNINYTGSKDRALQELYDKQAVEQDQAKRRKLVMDFETRLVDQAYIVPLTRTQVIAAVASKIKGWRMLPNPALAVDFRDVWLAK